MSFSINNTAVDPATEEGQIRLGKAHQERSRVICNCTSPSANADEIAALREVAADGTYPAWLWIEDDLMPELPAKGAQVADAPLIERKDA